MIWPEDRALQQDFQRFLVRDDIRLDRIAPGSHRIRPNDRACLQVD